VRARALPLNSYVLEELTGYCILLAYRVLAGRIGQCPTDASTDRQPSTSAKNGVSALADADCSSLHTTPQRTAFD
jgi:hypothetical protein